MRARTHEAAKIATSGGFTLLELLVVMVIIGLLAGFVAPRYFSQVGKSRVKAASAQIDALDKALEQFRIDAGRLPTTARHAQLGGAVPEEERSERSLGTPLRVCAAWNTPERLRPRLVWPGRPAGGKRRRCGSH
jgi:type II secretion system protein G